MMRSGRVIFLTTKSSAVEGIGTTPSDVLAVATDRVGATLGGNTRFSTVTRMLPGGSSDGSEGQHDVGPLDHCTSRYRAARQAP